MNNHRREIEITRNVVFIATVALAAIPLVAPVAIPAMAITSLGLLEIGLDLAVGDNTSAAAGLLCLFPMGKGFKFLKEIGGEAATSGSKAIKITNNFCENENILKKAFQKLSNGEKKLIEEGACFVAGTKIITKDGYKSIENIKIGDKVLSQNVDTEEKEYKEVKNIFVKEADTLVQIHIEESKIDTTKNHRFWIVDKGWIKAENLKEGEKILLSSGKISIISKVSKQKLKEAVKVYNFEVSDWHTYFISNIGVLVHNNCMAKFEGAAEAVKTAKGVLKDAQLPTQGKIRYVPPEKWTPSQPLPKQNGGIVDKFGNVWTKGPSRTNGQAFEWDVQLSKTGKSQLGWASRDGSHLNVSLDGKITHK